VIDRWEFSPVSGLRPRGQVVCEIPTFSGADCHNSAVGQEPISTELVQQFAWIDLELVVVIGQDHMIFSGVSEKLRRYLLGIHRRGQVTDFMLRTALHHFGSLGICSPFVLSSFSGFVICFCRLYPFNAGFEGSVAARSAWFAGFGCKLDDSGARIALLGSDQPINHFGRG